MEDLQTGGHFGFAFNDVDFSDRVLRVKITGDSFDSSSNCDRDDVVVPNRKRRRDVLSDSDSENGIEAGEESEDCDSDCSIVVEVKTYHISSPILAVKSPFFYKLFKNGMMESQQRNATLRINASEEAALMDLMKFMYTDTLSAATASDLLGVLMAADKFEVTSCMSRCVQMLLDLPMSLETAVLYLELPSSVQPLIDAATAYLVEHFRDFSKSQDEAMNLPLSGVEAVLGSDGLQVDSEDDVFSFITEWARTHYPKLEERREILTKRLLRFICSPYLSCDKLFAARTCPDFCNEEMSKYVVKALRYKIECPYGRHVGLFNRVYKYRLIKVVQLQSPQRHCFVFFDITKGECADLFLSKRRLFSQQFCLGGRRFSLNAKCHEYKQNPSFHHFALYLQLAKHSLACTVDFEFAVLMNGTLDFVTMYVVRDHLYKDARYIGSRNLFRISWDAFMADDSKYFIDGILHLRAKIIMKNSGP